ncbi:MAG: diphthamide synthesis protein [Candidatus Nanoarchaeia archaeon]|nr:diphthamide synthesis protein [Candidatus Nanoarchaeia archaeon]
MINKSFQEINEIYDLEIEKIVETIKKQKSKKVLLQFPDAMKRYADVIANELERKANCSCFIWFESCFGACDTPLGVEKFGIDLTVPFGHSEWKF